MAAVMVTLVVAWLRQADERGGETGWLEQARRDAFTRNVAVGAGRSAGADGAASDTDAISVGELDSDEQARLSYNAWLARLEEHR
jgi:hypothetical protein